MVPAIRPERQQMAGQVVSTWEGHQPIADSVVDAALWTYYRWKKVALKALTGGYRSKVSAPAPDATSQPDHTSDSAP